MDLVVVGIFAIIAAFLAGTKYGKSLEQEAVAKAVAKVRAEYASIDKTVDAFVSRVPGSLKSDYARAYDSFAAEIAKTKKAL